MRPRLDHQGDGLLKEQLRLEKGISETGETRWQLKHVNKELSFDKGFYVFIRALQLLSTHNSGCTIVGLAGASGSGKTTFTQRLESTMSHVTVLSMDMYNDGSKVRENNFDDPGLADYDLLLDNIKDLKAGRSCQAPIYDFKTSTRTGYREVKVPESRIIIVEGIYALSARVAPLLDLKVAITGGIHFDLVKRVMRDIQRSGQAADEIIQQISDTVYPMYKAFIEPDLKSAHIKIYNNFNPFAGFKDPVYILKTEDTFSLNEVRAVLDGMFGESAIDLESEDESYDIFLLPPGEDIQDCQSWLRMRNKQGRYSLMFAEWFINEPFIISPRISFEVPVKLLGGLMALGYTIGSIMSRISVRMHSSTVDVKWDRIEKLGCFMQIQGNCRETVLEVATKLGVKQFLPRSYIEQVQLLRLTEDFQEVNEEARRRFAFNEEGIIDDHVIGASPARPLMLRHGPNSSLHRAITMSPRVTERAVCSSAPSDSAWMDLTPSRNRSSALADRADRGDRGESFGSQKSQKLRAIVEGEGGIPAAKGASFGLISQQLEAQAAEQTRITLRLQNEGQKVPSQTNGTAGNMSGNDSQSSLPSFWNENDTAKAAGDTPPSGTSRPASTPLPPDLRPDLLALIKSVDSGFQRLSVSSCLLWAGAGFAAGSLVTVFVMRRS